MFSVIQNGHRIHRTFLYRLDVITTALLKPKTNLFSKFTSKNTFGSISIRIHFDKIQFT